MSWTLSVVRSMSRLIASLDPDLHQNLLTPPGLNNLPVVPKSVKTATGIDFDGVAFQGRICGVSIMRGESDISYRSITDI